MKGKVKFAFAAVLLAAFVTMFAGEVPAAQLKRPDWVGVKYTGYELRRNSKIKDIKDPHYWFLVLKFDIINNSKDGRIMTAIFDRTLSWNGVLSDLDNWNLYNGMPRYNLKRFIEGTKPYKGEWYPGQTYKYNDVATLGNLIGRLDYNRWEAFNQRLGKGYGKGHDFKLDKYSIDFQVSSKK
jgi:hypothetical protein